MPRFLATLQAVACLLCLAVPVAAQWSVDPQVNNPVSTASGHQWYQGAVSDGAGGVIVAWEDTRNAMTNVYAQRLDADGVPQWSTNGVRLCIYSSNQTRPAIVSDEAGGAIVVWRDETNDNSDIYAQRIDPLGVLLWDAIGEPVVTDNGDQYDLDIAPDGFGGVLVAWEDSRSGTDSVYAQRLDADGNQLWDTAGVSLCAASGVERNPRIAPDTGGGAVVCWDDTRDDDPNTYVYARRINFLGTPIWTTDGVRVADSTTYLHKARGIVSDGDGGVYVGYESIAIGDPLISTVRAQYLNAAGAVMWASYGYNLFVDSVDEEYAQFVPDGFGGAIVVCHEETVDEEFLIKAQRINEAGDFLWGLHGAQAMADPGHCVYPEIAADGLGGAVVAWSDFRHVTPSCYAQRFDAWGNRLWGDEGTAVNIVSCEVWYTLPVAQDDGSAIVVWMDTRASYYDLYAQKVDGSGYLGEPAPAVTSVTDFPNDQGGQVEVNWTASYLDAMPWHAVEDYAVWMRQTSVKGAVAPVDVATAEALGLPPERVDAFAAAGWTYVGTAPAMLEAEYGMLAPTYGDSTAAGIVTTEYMVSGHGNDVWEVWQADPLGGYSVDNLSPAAPLNLAGDYDGLGHVDLAWSAGEEVDLHHYVVYRGTSSSFPLDVAHRLGTSIGPVYEDPVASGTWYYRVTAVDVHDGESAPSGELLVDDMTDVTTPRMLALHDAVPNPFNPRTEIRFDLPRDGAVELSVHALDGRRVATLCSGELPAGNHARTWDGRDGGGRPVASGTYVCRLIAAGEHRHLKLSLLK